MSRAPPFEDNTREEGGEDLVRGGESSAPLDALEPLVTPKIPAIWR